MGLSRKMLAAMDIPAEKIDEIISAHSETVNAIKEERETFKAEAEKVSALEKQLETAKKELEEFKTGDWQAKYEKVKGEYDTYKSDVETKAVKTAKENAYKQLLLNVGISDKRIASVLKVSDIDGVELDKDGKIKDADKITENVKSEWADFIETKKEKGADVPKPPANNGGEDEKKPSRAANMAAQYYAEHYGNKPKED